MSLCTQLARKAKQSVLTKTARVIMKTIKLAIVAGLIKWLTEKPPVYCEPHFKAHSSLKRSPPSSDPTTISGPMEPKLKKANFFYT